MKYLKHLKMTRLYLEDLMNGKFHEDMLHDMGIGHGELLQACNTIQMLEIHDRHLVALNELAANAIPVYDSETNFGDVYVDLNEPALEYVRKNYGKYSVDQYDDSIMFNTNDYVG